MEITPKTFLDIFTRRSQPGAMTKDELLQRMDITLSTLDRPEGEPRPTARDIVNCYRGILLRFAQAIDDPEVTAKVEELMDKSLKYVGL